jgi:hypothetical protein
MHATAVLDAAPASINRPTVSLTEKGANLLALLACRDHLPTADTVIRAVLERRIERLLDID